MSNKSYFEFDPSEWFSGKIAVCDMLAQGIFINICALLWQKGGSMKYDADYLAKFLRIDKQCLSTALADLKHCLSINEGVLEVAFLNEQKERFSYGHMQKVEAGRKGGKARVTKTYSTAQAVLKQCSSTAKAPLQADSENKNQGIYLLYKDNKDSKKNKYIPQNPFSLEIAEWFLHEKRKGEFSDYRVLKNPSLGKWVKVLDELVRIDGKNKETIQAVLYFALHDNFWKSKLISLESLRKKGNNGLIRFENIQSQMEAAKKSPDKPTPQKSYGLIPIGGGNQ